LTILYSKGVPRLLRSATGMKRRLPLVLFFLKRPGPCVAPERSRLSFGLSTAPGLLFLFLLSTPSLIGSRNLHPTTFPLRDVSLTDLFFLKFCRSGPPASFSVGLL